MHKHKYTRIHIHAHTHEQKTHTYASIQADQEVGGKVDVWRQRYRKQGPMQDTDSVRDGVSEWKEKMREKKNKAQDVGNKKKPVRVEGFVDVREQLSGEGVHRGRFGVNIPHPAVSSSFDDMQNLECKY